MTVNTTTEWWDVDGTSLHTYATRIVNLAGTYSGAVPMRGDNMPVPYRPGQLWRSKVPDQRSISLGFLLSAYNSEGQAALDPLSQVTSNYQALRALLWRPGGEQYALTKRWRVGDTLLSATAQASYLSGLDVDFTGQHRIQVRTTAELMLADPYFYGAQQSVSVPTGGASTTNPGDASATGANMTLTFNGPMTNPTLTNSTLGITLAMGVVISGGDSVVVDCDNYTVTRTSDSANLIGVMSHLGSRNWFVLQRGSNALGLALSAGSGAVTVAYRPPYL